MTKERRWRNAGESGMAREIRLMLRLLCEWPWVAVIIGESNALVRERSITS